MRVDLNDMTKDQLMDLVVSLEWSVDRSEEESLAHKKEIRMLKGELIFLKIKLKSIVKIVYEDNTHEE